MFRGNQGKTSLYFSNDSNGMLVGLLIKGNDYIYLEHCCVSLMAVTVRRGTHSDGMTI